MKKGWNAPFGMVLTILACVLFSALIASPAARACLSDSGIVLLDGELPGGG